MKRTLPWAIVAFYPVIVGFSGNLLGKRIDAYFADQHDLSSLAEFAATYWWIIVVVTVICDIALFVINAVRSRRMLWATGMVLLGALVVPVYWWIYSERRAGFPTR